MKPYILTPSEFDKKQKEAERLQQTVAALPHDRRYLPFVKLISDYFVNSTNGYFSSYPIEKFFLGLAQKNHIALSTTYTKKSCLIVAHYMWEVGGDTRVIERWIETDSTRVYSIALTAQEANQITKESRIAKAVQKSGGQIFSIKGDDVISRSLDLRQAASAFEAVILFTYSSDIEPVIAFGTTEFTRPVGYYNAADHVFCLGVSISDAFAELRQWGRKLSLEHRGVTTSVLVPVPASENTIPKLSRAEARQRLGLPADCKIIVTAARDIKFMPISTDEDYTTIVEEVLEARKDIILICIGAKEEGFLDGHAFTVKWGKRFVLKGYVPHDELLIYFIAADVVLDSYPMGGITTLEDAIDCNTPILSFSQTFDFVNESPAGVSSKRELVDKVLLLLSDMAYAKNHASRTATALRAISGTEAFATNIANFFSVLEKSTHRVRMFASQPTGLTQAEMIRKLGEMYLSKRRIDKMLLRAGLIRPVWLAKALIQSLLWLDGPKLKAKLLLRLIFYPLVVLTRPIRHCNSGKA